MQIVILAGGKGTRIQSAAHNIPKSLIPVAGRPFIEWQFRLIKNSGMDRVLLCIGYKGEQIINHIGDGSKFGMHVTYSVEQPDELLGTGGALINATPLLEDKFFIMYGDSYLPTDYRKLADAFDATSAPAMMCVFQNRDRWDRSNVRVKSNKVVFYAKNAPPGTTDFIDYGLTAMRRDALTRAALPSTSFDLSHILQTMAETGQIDAYVVTERFYEIGKPAGLQELDTLLSQSGPAIPNILSVQCE